MNICDVWFFRSPISMAVAWFVLLTCGRSVLAAEEPEAEQQLSAEQIEFFEQKIRPVLVKHCYGCHSGRAKKIQGKFRLDSRQLIRKGCLLYTSPSPRD